jgi:hypothetical protein
MQKGSSGCLFCCIKAFPSINTIDKGRIIRYHQLLQK